MARDKDKKRAYNKMYRETHKEQARKYYDDHGEKISGRAKERYNEQPEKERSRCSQYKQAHKEEISIYNRKYKIKSYGLSIEDYNKILAEQNGICAICGLLPQEGTSLCIDHNHATGEVRGLLCIFCNLLLGNAGDKIETLVKAIEYLNARQ